MILMNGRQQNIQWVEFPIRVVVAFKREALWGCFVYRSWCFRGT